MYHQNIALNTLDMYTDSLGGFVTFSIELSNSFCDYRATWLNILSLNYLKLDSSFVSIFFLRVKSEKQHIECRHHVKRLRNTVINSALVLEDIE